MSAIDLNFDLRKGDFHLRVDTTAPSSGVTGLFGASGCGKTTLLRCIAGLEQHSGKPVHRRGIGYVFQEPQLFEHLNVDENIRYGWKRSGASDGLIEEVVSLLDIDRLMDREVGGLSGGEAQRVAIARALCMSPRLLLMDEPMSAVDERRKDDVLPYLDRLRQELAVPILYVSHNIDEICRLCDHLLVIDDGRVVAEGSLQSVLSRTDIPQLGGANTGVIIKAQFIRYDSEYDLSVLGFSGGELIVPGQVEQDRLRLRVRASDVSLARDRPGPSSILNILPASVSEVVTESASTALVKLVSGDDVLLSRVTNRSVRQLQLSAGETVFAQIKSVTVRR